MSKYKDDIIRLRKKGKSYREIEKKLGCSRGTISYHCKKEELEDTGMKIKKVSKEKIEAIRNYYKKNTRKKTAKKFKVSEATVQKYVNNKTNENKKTTRKVKKDTCKKGDVSEMKVKTKLLEKGYVISEPINSGSRYDLVVDKNNELNKIQVKTACSKNKEISVFPCYSSPQSGKKRVPYTKDEIDAFVIYSPDHDEVYWVDFNDAPKTTMTLRHEETKNNYKTGINWASNFKL